MFAGGCCWKSGKGQSCQAIYTGLVLIEELVQTKELRVGIFRLFERAMVELRIQRSKTNAIVPTVPTIHECLSLSSFPCQSRQEKSACKVVYRVSTQKSAKEKVGKAESQRKV